MSSVVITPSDREKIENLLYEMIMKAEKHIRESKEHKYVPYVEIALSCMNRAEDLIYHSIIIMDILKDMPYAINRLFTESAVLYVYYNVVNKLVVLNNYTEDEIRQWIRKEMDYIISKAKQIGVQITWYDELRNDIRRLGLYRD